MISTILRRCDVASFCNYEAFQGLPEEEETGRHTANSEIPVTRSSPDKSSKYSHRLETKVKVKPTRGLALHEFARRPREKPFLVRTSPFVTCLNVLEWQGCVCSYLLRLLPISVNSRTIVPLCSFNKAGKGHICQCPAFQFLSFTNLLNNLIGFICQCIWSVHLVQFIKYK